MAAFEGESHPMSRVMMLGLVTMVAALGYLGWHWAHASPVAVPVSQEAAPAVAPVDEPPPPPAAVPLSGERAAG